MNSEETSPWNSTFMQVVRWLILLPVGLGALVLAEVLVNLAAGLYLSWIESFSTFLLVVTGSIFLGVFLGIIGFIGTIAAAITASIAPDIKVGTVVLGCAYIVAQACTFYIVISDELWFNVVTKTLITGYVLFTFYHLYQEEL